MRRSSAFFLLTLLLIGLSTWAPAQMQQSGGASSSAANVSSIGAAAPSSAGLVGGTYLSSAPTLTNGQMGSFQLDANGNLKTLATVSGSVSLSGALPAGSNLLGTVKTVPVTACGTTNFSQALSAVPTTTTAVTATTSCVVVVIFNNTTSSSVSVNLSDNAGSPVSALLSFDIPAKSQLIQPLYGVQFTSGIKWSGSTTGITGAVLAYQ